MRSLWEEKFRLWYFFHMTKVYKFYYEILVPLIEFWLFFESAYKNFKSPPCLQERVPQLLCLNFMRQFHNKATFRTSFRCFPVMLITTFRIAGPNLRLPLFPGNVKNFPVLIEQRKSAKCLKELFRFVPFKLQPHQTLKA